MEAAIILPLILLMLFGIIDFGRVLQQQTTLVAAAREAARTAALNGTTGTVQTKAQGIVGTGTTITVTSVLCTGTNDADASVTVQQTFTPLTPIFSFMQMYGASGAFGTLKATGVMACTS